MTLFFFSRSRGRKLFLYVQFWLEIKKASKGTALGRESIEGLVFSFLSRLKRSENGVELSSPTQPMYF